MQRTIASRGIGLFFGLAIFALVIALILLRDEIPQWGGGGTRSVVMATVDQNSDLLTCPEPGSSIAFHGDSLVAGGRMGEGADPSRDAYVHVLARHFGDGVSVEQRGWGGATAEMGAQRWNNPELSGDIVVIAFGSNDAAMRGWLSTKEPVPLDDFAASLTRQVQFWRGEGRLVALMPPPPPGSDAMAERLAPYRETVAALGEQLDVAVLDPAGAFAQCEASGPLLTRDALHMNVAGHQCVGEWLVEQFCPTQPLAD